MIECSFLRPALFGGGAGTTGEEWKPLKHGGVQGNVKKFSIRESSSLFLVQNRMLTHKIAFLEASIEGLHEVSPQKPALLRFRRTDNLNMARKASATSRWRARTRKVIQRCEGLVQLDAFSHCMYSSFLDEVGALWQGLIRSFVWCLFN
jgi:hypothetical protein